MIGDYAIGYMAGKEDSEREFKKKVQEWYETLQSLRYKDVIVVLAEMNKYLRES